MIHRHTRKGIDVLRHRKIRQAAWVLAIATAPAWVVSRAYGHSIWTACLLAVGATALYLMLSWLAHALTPDDPLADRDDREEESASELRR